MRLRWLIPIAVLIPLRVSGTDVPVKSRDATITVNPREVTAVTALTACAAGFEGAAAGVAGARAGSAGATSAGTASGASAIRHYFFGTAVSRIPRALSALPSINSEGDCAQIPDTSFGRIGRD